jgi:hypothetical protein
MFRSVMLAVASLVLLAVAAPGAQARSAGGEGLDLRVTSLAFNAPTAACPSFRAHLRLTSDAGPATAAICFQADDFCRTAVGTWTLHLPGATVKALVVQRERCTFDAGTGELTATAIVFQGTVAKATGDLAGLVGGQVSGGGTTTFAADGTPTPDLVVSIGSGAGTAMAFEGTDTGTFSVVPAADPNLLLVQTQAAGRASRLGAVSWVASELNDQTTGDVYGTFILTTRHGAIFGTYTGFVSPTDSPTAVTYLVAGAITGGSGRYAGATGTVAFDGGGDFATGQLHDLLFGVVVT